MVYLFVRLFLWSIGALLVLSVLAVWGMLWLLASAAGVVWAIAHGTTHNARESRVPRPRVPRRGRSDAQEVDAFGHPISQSRYSGRR